MIIRRTNQKQMLLKQEAFSFIRKKRRAIKVPKGMEKKIGVKKAMPKVRTFLPF